MGVWIWKRIRSKPSEKQKDLRGSPTIRSAYVSLWSDRAASRNPQEHIRQSKKSAIRVYPNGRLVFMGKYVPIGLVFPFWHVPFGTPTLLEIKEV